MWRTLSFLLGLVVSVRSEVLPTLDPRMYREIISAESGLDMVFEGIDGALGDRPPLGNNGTDDVLESGLRARGGSPTKTHSCNHIRGVPSNLRHASEMIPHGLTQFYQKYTEAYGIPVVSSSKVPDDALRRGCYVLRFLLADHSAIRREFYRRHGRVGMVAHSEGITEIPEYSHLDPVFWNARARGLGATDQYPMCTGAEENILCYSRDRYPRQDICLHEYAHGVHALGAKYAISGWDNKLSYWYKTRKSQGLWRNTYSMSTYMEYFAEGVQSWFYVNREANPPDGINNHVNTREELKAYDYELYKLIAQVFPCKNTFIKRCEKSRSKELAQKLKMDCDKGDGDVEPDPDPEPEPDECQDKHQNCKAWKDAGYCSGDHEEYMSVNCKKSCGTCPDDETKPDPDPKCVDSDSNCNYWAKEGYCSDTTYGEWMTENCMKSCNKCRREEEEEDKENEDLPPVNCYDKDPKKCKKKAKKGHCTNPQKSGYMKKNCKKSCKLC